VRDFFLFIVSVVYFLILVAALVMTAPDVYLAANHMTPGTVRHVRAISQNHEGYRVNADSTVTFRDQVTNTWLTLPADQVNLFPRNKWWWQRIAPPAAK
jgi:hypothetical protein